MLQGKWRRSIIFCFLGMSIFIYHCDVMDNDDDNSFEEDGLTWIEGQSSQIDSTVYYVSTTGNDEASGIDEENSFGSVARALREVRPGGTVRILPGTYNEGLGLLNLGNVASAITITGHEGRPVFDGQNDRTIALFCENCTNIVFQNLEVKRYTDIGIGATLSDGIVFRDLVVENNGHAVQLIDWELEGYGIHVDESANILIANNDVSENGPQPQVFPDRLMGTGINTYRITDSVIRNNLSHGNIGGGILVEDSEDVLVENNEIYANDCDATSDGWWDGGIWLDGGQNVTIRNNVFRDNLGPGIEISDEDSQSPVGYILENNISIRNYYGIFIWNFGTSDWPPEEVLRRSGNQFTDNTRQDVWIVAGDSFSKK